MTASLLIEQRARAVTRRGRLGEGRGQMPSARDLHPCPLDEALKAVSGGIPRVRVMTMGTAQWDGLLSAAYAAGWILLEMNADEVPVRAYRKVK